MAEKAVMKRGARYNYSVQLEESQEKMMQEIIQFGILNNGLKKPTDVLREGVELVYKEIFSHSKAVPA